MTHSESRSFWVTDHFPIRASSRTWGLHATSSSEDRLNNMWFTRLAAALLALLLMSTTGIGDPKSNATRRRGMTFTDVGEINGDLAAIVGTIGPNSFFENLRSVDSNDRTMFLNDLGEVPFFPDRMTITLFIIGPLPKEHGKTRPSGFDTQYMNELKFKAEWKRGIELRPVKTFRQLTASVTEPPSFAAPLGVRECWIYEFVIEDTEVPASDHLIFFVMSPENKRLARLSAHL
jgi:hypothetical protein